MKTANIKFEKRPLLEQGLSGRPRRVKHSAIANGSSTQSTSDPEANALNAEGLRDMLTARDLEAVMQIDRKTIYAYVQRGLIPYLRIESNVRFSKHQIMRWLEERSFQPRSVYGKGARRQ